jgi:hypothetical protein
MFGRDRSRLRSRGGGATFNPLSIPNLALWLDAADTSTITHTSNSVSQWNDKSGNGNNATQGTGANQPVTNTRTINGRNVLDFNVAEPRMNLPVALTGDKNTTCFYVFQVDVSKTHRLMNGTNAGGTRVLMQQTAFQYQYMNRNDFTATSAISATFDTNAHIGIARRDGVNKRAGRDGVLGTELTSAQDAVLTGLTIGSAGATDTFDGACAEIILYQRGLTNAEMNAVGRYLSAKWNIAWTDLPVTAFAPTDIAGLQLWLDASDTASITHTANSVSQWNDKSGNSRHATQGTATNQPTTNTRTLNSRNVIDFDGTNDTLVLPSGIYGFTNGNNSVFAVYANDVIAGGARFIMHGTNGTQTFLLNENPDSNRLETRQHASTNMFVTHADDTVGIILSYLKNGAEVRARRNGPSLTTGTNAAGGQNFTLTSAHLGSESGTINYWDGVLAEIIIYNTVLSDADQNIVGNYLASKWGITWTNI